MKIQDFSPNTGKSVLKLPDGTPAVIRPIRKDGGPKLVEGLRKLSPQSRYQRFLAPKSSFSNTELNYLTHCDGVNHLALVLAITDPDGNEKESVAIARCIRDQQDPSLGEIAFVVLDQWQQKGIGKRLVTELARRCIQVGIKRWRAVSLPDNTPARKLIRSVAVEESRDMSDPEVVEAVYQVNPVSQV